MGSSGRFRVNKVCALLGAAMGYLAACEQHCDQSSLLQTGSLGSAASQADAEDPYYRYGRGADTSEIYHDAKHPYYRYDSAYSSKQGGGNTGELAKLQREVAGLKHRLDKLELKQPLNRPAPAPAPPLPVAPPGKTSGSENCSFALGVMMRDDGTTSIHNPAKWLAGRLAGAGIILQDHLKPGENTLHVGEKLVLPWEYRFELHFDNYDELLRAQSALASTLYTHVPDATVNYRETFQRGNLLRATALPPLDECTRFQCVGRQVKWEFSLELKMPDPASCRQFDIHLEFMGPSIPGEAPTQVKSRGDCESRCASLGECRYYNFYPNSTCALIGAGATARYTDDEVRGGHFACNNACFATSWTVGGEGLMKNATSKRQTLDECRKDCRNAWECIAVNFDQKDGTCELYSKVVSASRVRGVVSARPVCFSKPSFAGCEKGGLYSFNHFVGFEPLTQTIENVRMTNDPATNLTVKTFDFYASEYWHKEEDIKGLIDWHNRRYDTCHWSYKREDNKQCPDEFN